MVDAKLKLHRSQSSPADPAVDFDKKNQDPRRGQCDQRVRLLFRPLQMDRGESLVSAGAVVGTVCNSNGWIFFRNWEMNHKKKDTIPVTVEGHGLWGWYTLEVRQAAARSPAGNPL